MAGGFDKFMNFIIPAALIIIPVGWIYFKFKVPIKSFFEWIGNMFTSAKDNVSQQDVLHTSRDIVINY